MYHEKGMKQQEIASRRGLSQAGVSRLLKQAQDLGLVRTVVSVPPEVHPELEERLEERYGLDQVVLVATESDADLMYGRLGNAAARYLESTVRARDVIGVSSWSESLLRAARAMGSTANVSATSIVQLVGGMGNTEVQVLATQIMQLLSTRLKAEPVFMLTPAVMGSPFAAQTLREDPTFVKVSDIWDTVTVAVFGVGAITPSALLARSGNSFREGDRERLAEAGAVGDVCLRYFDAQGTPVVGDFDDCVMSITREQLLRVPRRLAVAGGEKKYDAIRGCLLGGWATSLITDAETAERLADE